MLIDKEVMYKGRKLTYDELKPHSMIKIKVSCDRCGKEFISTKYQLERNGHQYCQACALYLKQTKYLNPGDKYGRLTVIGPGSRPGYSLCRCRCGNEKEIVNWSLKRGVSKSCGCLQKELAAEKFRKLAERNRGENNHNWKGGITDEKHKLSSSSEFLKIKSYNRTLFRCIHCDSAEKIVVHHIIAYSKDPSKFLDPNNIVPMCEKCHREYHHLYGFKGGEKEFNEYLQRPIDPLDDVKD